jgi:two-component system response regulator YesN
MTTILIADDEKNIRAGIQKILREEFAGDGIAFFEAKNGEEALELAVREKPDILITDIRMPRIDGIELMRRIRLYLNNSGMNIIVLSGYDEFSYAQKAIDYHAASYILKPVDRGELAEAVRNLIHGEAGQKRGGLDRDFIEDALAWIKDHLTEGITMAQAANQVSVNYSYFSEKFKKHTGIHFNEYLKRRRIALAMRLLAGGNYRVYEAAEKCGYRDVKYFLRQFKEIAGLSPGKWSRLHRT